jgi:hypothetical protein
LTLAWAQEGIARDVFVSVTSGEEGHGFLRQMQGECYVLLPKHVIEMPGEITVVSPGGENVPAEVFKVDPSSDLALLRLKQGKKMVCSGLEASTSRVAVSDALEGATEAILHSVTADGSLRREKVFLEELTDQTLTFTSAVPGSLQKGMSGSVLSVKNVQVGMLVDIKDGKGFGYRQEVLEDFWNRAKPHVNDCSTGCQFTLSSANFVRSYQPSTTEGEGTIVTITKTRYDNVYRVPEGWPLPPYFHVWRDKLENRAEGAGPPAVIDGISNFSFSFEPSNRAADITINAPAFETLGEATTIATFRNRTWTIRVSEERDHAELQVSIKRWVAPY